MLIVIIAVACAATGGQSDSISQQRKWEEARISHYRFELRIVCYCPFRGRMPLQIEVLDGQMVSMKDAHGVIITKTDAHFEYFDRYATMDRLFSVLEAHQGGKADRVTAKFHPVYGFPEQIYIDRIKGAADDELRFVISGFEQLP
ncbi:MAG: hypothetical protein KF839_04460 [Nitrosomonas sp.]|nr:hypothetical protein [Nitrosomonas sp.]